jgi:hypothetical protein
MTGPAILAAVVILGLMLRQRRRRQLDRDYARIAQGLRRPDDELSISIISPHLPNRVP